MKTLEIIYASHNRGETAPGIAPAPIPYFDLTLLLSGRLCYTVNGETFVLESGDAICIPAGSLRARRKNTGVDYVSFNFTTEEDISLPLVLKNVVRSEIALLIAAYDKMEKHACIGKTAVTHLCACLLSSLADITAAAQYSPLTKKILTYIHEDISRKITLEDIGKLTFFSPIYCDTVFKREMGRSIVDYTLDRRVDGAKRLLLEGTVPLQEIAAAMGFHDYNYFSRVFKRRSGYSPSAYRRLTPDHLK